MSPLLGSSNERYVLKMAALITPLSYLESDGEKEKGARQKSSISGITAG
jgi:hypothetical protein